MQNFKPALATLLVFILIVVALISLSRADYSWADWKAATCMPDMCFCEAIRPGSIAQPANTWSSLGFVLVGLLILSRRFFQSQPASGFSTMHTLVYALATIFIGLGSTFYHASLTFVGQFFDVLGMYLLGGFILLHNLARARSLVAKNFVAAYVALNLALAVLLITLPELRRYLFAALILAALVWAYHPRRPASSVTQRKYLAWAVITLLLAFIIFLLDLTKIFCSPYSWLQGHALWHLGGALAAGLLYRHYSAE